MDCRQKTGVHGMQFLNGFILQVADATSEPGKQVPLIPSELLAVGGEGT